MVFCVVEEKKACLRSRETARESSFNMTRGGGDEDIEGASENLFTSKPTGGG